MKDYKDVKRREAEASTIRSRNIVAIMVAEMVIVQCAAEEILIPSILLAPFLVDEVHHHHSTATEHKLKFLTEKAYRFMIGKYMQQ